MLQVVIDFGTFSIFGLHIPVRILGYGLMMVLGFACGILLAQRLARRAGESTEVLMHCGILALIGGIVGARAAYIIQHWDTQFANAPNQCGAILDVSSGGLIYYGGVALAVVLVLGYLWIKRMPVRRFLDILAASTMVGLAFGRSGCLLNGCCYGPMCRQDWPMGIRFPMFSVPLLKLSGTPGPFSDSTDAPSPVYAVQFRDGLVDPDDRLVRHGPGGPRIRLPQELHGTLDHDQLVVMFGTKQAAQEKFDKLAGSEKLLSRPEWDRGLAQADGFLRGSEHWDDAVAHDKDHDGKLSFPEAWNYLQVRKQLLVRRFGSAEEGNAQVRWGPHGQQWHRADAYLRADLFALARAQWSRKVQPAQPLGIANALLIAAVLLAFYRVRRREGQVFALMMLLYPITRFVLESIRSDNPHNLLAGQLTHNQYTSLGTFAAGVILLLVLRRLPASAGPAWGERLAQAAARGTKKSRKP